MEEIKIPNHGKCFAMVRRFKDTIWWYKDNFVKENQ